MKTAQEMLHRVARIWRIHGRTSWHMPLVSVAIPLLALSAFGAGDIAKAQSEVRRPQSSKRISARSGTTGSSRGGQSAGAGGTVLPMCNGECSFLDAPGAATASADGGSVATPVDTSYSVHHLIGGDVLGNGSVLCTFIFADPPSGAPDDTVLFDGIEEPLRTDIRGTIPLVTETLSDNGDGTTRLVIESRSHNGAALFPAGIIDPGSGVQLTDACFSIGFAPPPFGDPLDWPGLDTVVLASITYLSNGSIAAGPIDVTALFSNPWDGRFGGTLPGGSELGIDAVKLEIVAQKTSQDPVGACCLDGVCIGDIVDVNCRFQGGSWIPGGSCGDDPNRPAPVCAQADCSFNNGPPLDDGGGPANQFASDFPFSAGAVDDFILNSSTGNACRIETVRAWMMHNPSSIDPNTAYDGINLTIYADADPPGPNGRPENDGSHSTPVAGGIVYTQMIPMSVVSAIPFNSSCVTGLWQLDLPVNIVLNKDTRYWLEVQPIMTAGMGRSFSQISENANLLVAKQIAERLGITSWRDILGNADQCSGGTPPTPNSQTRHDLAFQLLGTSVGTPENDECPRAIPVSDGIVSYTNVGAVTDGPDEAGRCGPDSGFTQVGSDIWYEYHAACTGTLTVSLCGSSYDTKLAVYDDCAACPPRTLSVGCNDDFCGPGLGLQSEVVFPVQEGACFRIRVGGFIAEQGKGVLSIECAPPPPPSGSCCDLATGSCQDFQLEADCTGLLKAWTQATACAQLDPPCVATPPSHDNCENCIPVVTGEPFSATTVGADGVDVTSCATLDTKDVWHCWTADCSGSPIISLCDTPDADFDTTLALFDACGGNELACNDDRRDRCLSHLHSEISPLLPPSGDEPQVVEGRTYYIRVAGFDGTQGIYTLSVDGCASACCVASGPFEGVCGLLQQNACERNGNVFHGQGSVCLGDRNSNGIDDVCEQMPGNWVWKDYNDQGTGGYLPDYDQNKDYDNADGDLNPSTGVDAFYGGPTAVADSLVWLDNKFPGLDVVAVNETKIGLIEGLATLMGTNGSTAHPSPNGHVGPYGGTFFNDMRSGANAYLAGRGLSDLFVAQASFAAPRFDDVSGDLLAGDHVVLLLGFYQMQRVTPIGTPTPTGYVVGWRRTGGHYVAVAGVDPVAVLLGLSDPDADAAEELSLDFVRGGDHNHDGDAQPSTSLPFRDPNYDPSSHNDITLASHDVYEALPALAPSPDNSAIPGGEFLIAAGGDPLAYANMLASFHAEDAGGAFDVANTFVGSGFLQNHGYPLPAIGQVYTVVESALTISLGPTRACCLSDGSCAELSPADCVQQAGVPLDPGTACTGDNNSNGVDDACEVVGDLDGDRDVDLNDWNLMTPCLDGPASSVATGCELTDLNGDGRTDLADVAVFLASFTGSG